MKKICLGICLFLVLIINSLCVAAAIEIPRENDEITASQLTRMSGTWYYTNGNEALVITPTTISGATVEGGYAFVGGDPGSGLFKFSPGSGNINELRIGWHFASTNASHQYLFLNGRALRRSWVPQYSESIGGAFLGMSREEAIRVLGRPSQENQQKKILYYDKLGMNLGFDNGIVYNIIVKASSNLAFENSNLKATASLLEFKKNYGMDKLPVAGDAGGPNKIADGEYLWFTNYPEEVQLSLYDT